MREEWQEKEWTSESIRLTLISETLAGDLQEGRRNGVSKGMKTLQENLKTVSLV